MGKTQGRIIMELALVLVGVAVLFFVVAAIVLKKSGDD